MSFPLIGQAKRKEQQKIEAQKSMMEKLQEWEVKEGIRVEPVLLADRKGIYAKLEFHKMDEETKKLYSLSSSKTEQE